MPTPDPTGSPTVRHQTRQPTTGARPRTRGIPKSKNDPRLAAWLSNPGLRSKLADHLLTDAQRRERQTQTRLRAPSAPGSQITNREMKGLLDAAVQAKYGEQDRLLAQQVSELAAQRGRVPGYFDQYRALLAGQQQAQQAQTQSQVAAIQGVGASSAQSAADANRIAFEQAQRAAALSGGQVDPAAAARAAAAAAVTGANVGGFAQAAQTSGDAQSQFLGNLGLLTNNQQTDALGALDKQKTELDDLARRLATAKGDFRTETQRGVLADEQKSALEAALFGLKERAQTLDETQEANDVADENADRRADSRQWNATVNKYGVTNGAWAAWGKSAAGRSKRQQAISDYNASKGGGSPSTKDEHGNTPKQQKAAADSYDKAKIQLDTVLATPKDGKRVKELMQSGNKEEAVKILVRGLVAGFNVNSTIARGVAQMHVYGRVGPKTKREFESRGIKLPQKTRGQATREAGRSIANTVVGLVR